MLNIPGDKPIRPSPNLRPSTVCSSRLRTSLRNPAVPSTRASRTHPLKRKWRHPWRRDAAIIQSEKIEFYAEW